jgi:hypothetical protein
VKRFHMSVCALMCFAVGALPCVGQSNPWNGSWKMDVSSIKYAGPTFSVAMDGEGYTLTRGGKTEPKRICDGQPHADPDGTMMTCTKSGSGYQVDSTKSGEAEVKATISLSKDGNMLTRKALISPPGGTPFTVTIVSKRLSGGPGVSGTWKEIHFEETSETGLLTVAISGDSVAFKETDAEKPTVCKLDGTEVKLGGTSTMAVKQEGSHTLKVTYRTGGKIRRENTFELSPDGKTIKETDVTPEPTASTTSMLFHKSS